MVKMAAVETLWAGFCRVEGEWQKVNEEFTAHLVERFDADTLVEPFACEHAINFRGIVTLCVVGDDDLQTRIERLAARRASVGDGLRDLMITHDVRIKTHLHRA